MLCFILIVFTNFLQNMDKFLNKKRKFNDIDENNDEKKMIQENYLFRPPNLIHAFQVPTGCKYKYQNNYLSFEFTHYESETHTIPHCLVCGRKLIIYGTL